MEIVHCTRLPASQNFEIFSSPQSRLFKLRHRFPPPCLVPPVALLTLARHPSATELPWMLPLQRHRAQILQPIRRLSLVITILRPASCLPLLHALLSDQSMILSSSLLILTPTTIFAVCWLILRITQASISSQNLPSSSFMGSVLSLSHHGHPRQSRSGQASKRAPW